MNVHTRNPQCHVRFVSLEARYGEIAADIVQSSLRQVSVHRRMGEAAGAFQIVLLPREMNPLTAPGLPRHWRDILGAMDYVEIEMHVPPRVTNIVMRGFIDTVTDEFSISGGSPQRVITVNGRDYGMLLLNTKIYYADMPEMTQIVLLKQWKEGLTKWFSWKDGKQPPPISPPLPRNAVTNLPEFHPKDLISNIVDSLYRPQETNILNKHPHAPQLEFHTLDGALTQAGETTLSTIAPAFLPINFQPFTDVWTIMRIYQHHPWRELYIEDTFVGPRLVFRPTPWLDFHGTPVQASFELYEDTLPHHRISEAEIISTSLSHSGEEVRNYFSVTPDGFGAFAMMVKTIGPLEGFFTKPMFRGNPYLSGRWPEDETEDTGIMKRSNYLVAGFRTMEIRTPYLDFDRRMSEGKVQEHLATVREQGGRANEWLRRAFDHGAVLEFGAIQLKGNEQIRIGDYLVMDSGPRLDLGQDARYYVEGVAHVFRQGSAPSDGLFITTCEVSRGRGHLIRKGMAAS